MPLEARLAAVLAFAALLPTTFPAAAADDEFRLVIRPPRNGAPS